MITSWDPSRHHEWVSRRQTRPLLPHWIWKFQCGTECEPERITAYEKKTVSTFFRKFTGIPAELWYRNLLTLIPRIVLVPQSWPRLTENRTDFMKFSADRKSRVRSSTTNQTTCYRSITRIVDSVPEKCSLRTRGSCFATALNALNSVWSWKTVSNQQKASLVIVLDLCSPSFRFLKFKNKKAW